MMTCTTQTNRLLVSAQAQLGFVNTQPVRVNLFSENNSQDSI